MNPFSNFNHFIAFFLPGVVLVASVLAGASLAIDKDLIALLLGLPTQTLLLIIILAGALFGLLLDEVRHVCIEGRIEEAWARNHVPRYKLDSMPLTDFICYVSTERSSVTLNAYLAMVDQFFHFYEFDINMALVLGLFSCWAVPWYLSQFILSWKHHADFIVLVGLVLLLIGAAFFRFGIHVYEHFLDVFVDAMDKGEPGFKKSIQ
jgi:hypothetical protein